MKKVLLFLSFVISTMFVRMRIHTGHTRHTISLSAAKALFALAVALVVCLCCRREPSSAQLDRAEALLFDNPDSAMALVSEQRTPRQALLYNAAHYVKYKEIDKDLEEYTYTHYIEKKTESTKSELCMAKLFHGIRLYEEEQFTEAMGILLKLEEDIHELPHPYFKGVAQFYMACIYLREDLYKNSLTHFKRELGYSKEIGDSAIIAKAENHVSVLFCRLEEQDSCLYHIRCALAYQDKNDSVELANIYNNLAASMDEYYPDSISEIESYFKKALAYKGDREYATMANLADFYYRHGRIAEAESIACEIQANAPEDVRICNARLLISQTMYSYYDSIGIVDSAYKYHKLYLKYDSIENNLTEQKDIVKVTEKHVGKEIIDKYVLSLKNMKEIVMLLVLSVVAIFSFLYRSKSIFRKEKAVLKHTLQNVKLEKTFIEKESVNLKRIIKKKDKENDALRSDIKEYIKKLDLLNQSSSVVICKLLERKSGRSNVATYYDMLYEELVKKTNDKSFINDIQMVVPEIKRREEVICLLLLTGYKNEKICEIIDLEPGTYRTAKSRLKAKLLENCGKSETIDLFLKTYF